MLKNKKAFTLIELLVYSGLLCFYTLSIFQFIIHMYRGVKKNMQVSTMVFQRTALFDTLRRDIMCAGSSFYTWDAKKIVFTVTTIEKNALVTTKAVGYVVREKTLYRVHGDYNFATCQWGKKTMAKLHEGVTEVRCVLDQEGHVKAAQVTVQFDKASGTALPQEASLFINLKNSYVA